MPVNLNFSKITFKNLKYHIATNQTIFIESRYTSEPGRMGAAEVAKFVRQACNLRLDIKNKNV